MSARLLPRCAVLVGFGLWLSAVGAADFDDGRRAYERGDFASAFRAWKKAADAGEVNAQYRLGELYRDGRGIPQDMLEWAHWWWRAAQGGHAEARRGVVWPFAPGTEPSLACTPRRPPGGRTDQVVQVDYLQLFDFVVTLRNTRLVIEQMALADVENYTQGFEPARPNLEITVTRVEGERRVPVPRRLAHSGGSGGGSGPYGDEARRGHSRNVGPSEDSASVSVKIPPEESERQRYVEQFLEALAKQPRVTPDEVSQARVLFGNPNARTYLDDLMPNRPGVYEIECRYRSRDPRFWPGALVASPLRVEFVKRQEWIDALLTRVPRPP